MKFKVFLSVGTTPSSPSSGDAGGTLTFYTKSQAVACCEAWRNIDSKYFAYLWDGSQWIEYIQIP